MYKNYLFKVNRSQLMDKFLRLLAKYFPDSKNLNYSEYETLDKTVEGGPFLPRIYSKSFFK